MNALDQTEAAVKDARITQEASGVHANTASCYKGTGKRAKVKVNFPL